MCVHRDRVAAGARLVAEGVTIVIADDGLQHYRLHRDLEIAVVDGERRLGNGFLLPAGPLREPAGRLAQADLVLVHGGTPREGEFRLQATISGLRSLDGGTRCALGALRGQRVRTIAGIGNPARFEGQLSAAGLEVDVLPVADHGRVDLAELCRRSAVPIVMTEKDAVKYAAVDGCAVWVAELAVTVDPEVGVRVLKCLGRFEA